MSPANVVKVEVLDEENKSCRVTVPDSQLSLAIGNRGQNARLAARLTSWKVDIRPESGFYGEDEKENDGEELIAENGEELLESTETVNDAFSEDEEVIADFDGNEAVTEDTLSEETVTEENMDEVAEKETVTEETAEENSKESDNSENYDNEKEPKDEEKDSAVSE